MMKKIVNWLFGSVFRTFGRILAYIIVGGILVYVLGKSNIPLTRLIGIQTVNAATVSKSSDKWATQWCDNRSCDYSQAGSTYFRDYENVDSGAYSNSNYYYLTAIRLRQQFSSANYLVSGTQYQFRYKLWFNPMYELSYYGLSDGWVDFYVTDSGGNQTEVSHDNYTCSFTKIQNSNSFFFTCIYTPTTSLKQVYFRIKTNFAMYVSASNYSGYIWKSLNTINYTSSSITYNTGTQDAIQNQTTTIVNEFNNVNENINNIDNSINNINDNLLDDDVSDATSEASDFFSNFQTPTHGLTSIITAPLSTITSLASKQCSPLILPLPFVNENLTLPCMRDIYMTYWPSFMAFYDVLCLGIVTYWIMVRIFALVKDFKNPDKDEIEVVDL